MAESCLAIGADRSSFQEVLEALSKQIHALQETASQLAKMHDQEVDAAVVREIDSCRHPTTEIGSDTLSLVFSGNDCSSDKTTTIEFGMCGSTPSFGGGGLPPMQGEYIPSLLEDRRDHRIPSAGSDSTEDEANEGRPGRSRGRSLLAARSDSAEDEANEDRPGIQQNHASFENEDDDNMPTCSKQSALVLKLDPLWTHKKVRVSRSRRKMTRASTNDLTDSEGLEFVKAKRPSRKKCRELIQKSMVMDPSSKWRLVWDGFGMIAITWDLISIPMQIAFQIRRQHIFEMMAWFTALFWTLDIPRSFLLGYHHKGKSEMRLTKIARRYITTWFPMDVLVVGGDWILMFADYLIEAEANHAQYVRMARALRFMRMIRLLRLLKVHGIINDFLELVQSESFRIYLGIFKLVVLIMVVNHCIACGFYWTGTRGSISDDTWVEFNRLYDRTLAYKYMTSLHWSLTQFTPATCEIAPRTEGERIYAVFTVVFAMVTFSSFISSLTGAMNLLRNLDSERDEQCMMLRRYLNENNVDNSIAGRICCWVELKPNKRKRRIRIENVKLLQTLPKKLQVELHQSVYGPILSIHPLFARVARNYHKEIKLIYECVQELSVDIGQELFTTESTPTHMYFVIDGALTYTTSCPGITPTASSPAVSTTTSDFNERYVDKDETFVTPISVGNWICEPILWFEWRYRGQLLAGKNSEFVGLNAETFRTTMATHVHYMREFASYAWLLARYIQKHRVNLTDVPLNTEVIYELARASFEEKPENEVFESVANKPEFEISALPSSRGSFDRSTFDRQSWTSRGGSRVEPLGPSSLPSAGCGPTTTRMSLWSHSTHVSDSTHASSASTQSPTSRRTSRTNSDSRPSFTLSTKRGSLTSFTSGASHGSASRAALELQEELGTGQVVSSSNFLLPLAFKGRKNRRQEISVPAENIPSMITIPLPQQVAEASDENCSQDSPECGGSPSESTCTDEEFEGVIPEAAEGGPGPAPDRKVQKRGSRRTNTGNRISLTEHLT